ELRRWPKSALDSCVRITAPKSSNTRMFADCERERDRYFAYATALRIASGPAYQIEPYRNPSLIKSTPAPVLRGRTSYRSQAVNPLTLFCPFRLAIISSETLQSLYQRCF